MPHAHLVKFDSNAVDKNGFVSVSRAANLLDVSPSTVYKMIHDKKFTGYKIGKNIRIKAKEFLRFIDVHAEAL